MSIEIINGDCLEELKQIPDNSIDLTVTSPPYDNLRTYAGTLNWTFDIFKGIAEELYRVTKSGGVIVWVSVMLPLKVAKRVQVSNRRCISKKLVLISTTL